jgi:dTDP-L-rhamnose 4-epimerase
MTRVLVTGGAGFVGSHVVDALAQRGDEVVVLDLLHPFSHEGEPEYLHPDVEYVWGDLGDRAVVERVVRGVDAVCHQASMVGLGVDFGDTEAYVRHNDVGTAVLLASMHARRFRGRLVLASSMVVYGEGRYRCPAHGIVRPGPRGLERLRRGDYDPPCPSCGRPLDAEPVPEDTPADPRNVYAATKVHQEHLSFAYGRAAAVPVVALRYHNVYGPRMPRDTPYAGVASVFRTALDSGRAPRVCEDGLQRRDFVHVRDVARANVLALTADRLLSGAFNVATGEPHTVGEMAAALSAESGPDAPRPVVTGVVRPGDVRHVFASPDRAAARLGFRAEVGFAQGMREFAHAALRSPVPPARS